MWGSWGSGPAFPTSLCTATDVCFWILHSQIHALNSTLAGDKAQLCCCRSPVCAGEMWCIHQTGLSGHAWAQESGLGAYVGCFQPAREVPPNLVWALGTQSHWEWGCWGSIPGLCCGISGTLETLVPLVPAADVGAASVWALLLCPEPVWGQLPSAAAKDYALHSALVCSALSLLLRRW